MRGIKKSKHQTVNHKLTQMTKKEILDQLEPLVSSAKAAVYKNQNADDWLGAYKAEITLAKEMFIYLHFLEIFLRNKIAHQFNLDFGDWLCDARFNFKFDLKEKEKISHVLMSLNKSKKEINSDNVVSNLSLGFWTNLFHKPYTKAWQKNKMIARVFPFLKSHQRDLKQIQKELEAIRKFRNRIFHFESLSSWNFKEMENLIDKFIHGISGVKIREILNE